MTAIGPNRCRTYRPIYRFSVRTCLWFSEQSHAPFDSKIESRVVGSSEEEPPAAIRQPAHDFAEATMYHLANLAVHYRTLTVEELI